MNDIAMNEEKIFLESLEQLVELAKSKKNMLEISDIDKFLKDKSISAEHIDLIYQYLEEKKIDVVPNTEEAFLEEDDLLLEPTDDDFEDDFDDGKPPNAVTRTTMNMIIDIMVLIPPP